MFRFIQTFLARRRCPHEWETVMMTNMGMGKMLRCKKCGKTSFV